jgi:hypothetical protein
LTRECPNDAYHVQPSDEERRLTGRRIRSPGDALWFLATLLGMNPAPVRRLASHDSVPVGLARARFRLRVRGGTLTLHRTPTTQRLGLRCPGWVKEQVGVAERTTEGVDSPRLVERRALGEGRDRHGREGSPPDRRDTRTTHAAGRTDRPAGERRTVEPGDRRAAVHQRPHGRVAPEQGVREARHHLTQTAAPRAQRACRSCCGSVMHSPTTVIP